MTGSILIPSHLAGSESTESNVVEAEDTHLSGPMEVLRDPRASGGRAVLIPDGVSTSELDAGMASFCYEIHEEGDYRVTARVFSPSSEADSFKVRIGRSSPFDWEFGSAMGYTQRVVAGDDLGSEGWRMPEGPMVIEFIGSEPGARLDWVSVDGVEGSEPTLCDPLKSALTRFGNRAPADAESPPTSTTSPSEAAGQLSPGREGSETDPNKVGANTTTTTLQPTQTTVEAEAPSSGKPGVSTTTSQPPKKTPKPPPSPGGSFGAGAVGPSQEGATTKGVVATPQDFKAKISAAAAGQTVLLIGGSYAGGFDVPAGVSVKPYNGEPVTIRGSIKLASGSVLAGFTIEGNGQWAVEVEGGSSAVKDAVIRHNKITGGTVETIRVSRNAHGISIIGNDLPSSDGNHIIKFHHEDTGMNPSGSIVGNLIGSPQKGDGIQIQTHGSVLIDKNTFLWAPENNLDIKAGSVTVRRNLFADSNQGALLVHHDGNANIHNNRFAGGKNIALGSKNTGQPTWNLHENLIEGGQISMRKSYGPAIVEANTMLGGTVKVGFSGDDYPRDPRVIGNRFEGTELVDRVTQHGVDLRCTGNVLVDVSGDWQVCD